MDRFSLLLGALMERKRVEQEEKNDIKWEHAICRITYENQAKTMFWGFLGTFLGAKGE